MSRPPYVRSGSPRRPGVVRPVEQGHRHRVGPLEALERLAGRAAALPVHRRQHRHLRDRPLDPQPLRHRRVEVVGPGGGGERGVARTRPRAPEARSGRGRRARARARRARRPRAQHRRAGCAGRSRRSSGRPRRRRRSTARAAGRRGRRGRRATGSRRSSRSARRAASRAGRRRPGAPCGTARAPTCGCSARRPPRRASISRTCAGLRRSVDSRPGTWRSTSASRARREASLLGIRRRARSDGVGEQLLGARPVDRQPVAPQLEAQHGRGRLREHRADQPHRGRRGGVVLQVRRLERRPRPGLQVARGRAATPRGRRAGGRASSSSCRGRPGRASAANSKRSPVGGSGTSSTGMPCAAAQHWPAVALHPPWRRRWASRDVPGPGHGHAGHRRGGPLPTRPTTRPSAASGSRSSRRASLDDLGERPRAGDAVVHEEPPTARRGPEASRRAPRRHRGSCRAA